MKILVSAALIAAATSANALPEKVCKSYSKLIVSVANGRDQGVSQETNRALLSMVGREVGQSDKVTNAMVDFVYANHQETPVSAGLKFYTICMQQ